MSDDRSLPERMKTHVVSPFDAGMIAALRREIAELTACREASRHFVAAMEAALQLKQQALGDRDATLARYCQTIDEQRALIEELQAERDAWRDKAQRTAGPDAPKCDAVHGAVWPAFPARALRSEPWTPVV